MSVVSIHAADGLGEFLDFCKLPRLIYSNSKEFTPPLDIERWTLYSKRLNPHFGLVESRRWLARKDGKYVGRVFAQIYKDGVAPVGASRAQFGCLDAIDDNEVVDALLTSAEQWLASRGATVVHGPYSPSVNSESGLLVSGFDAPSMILMPWNPSYLPEHLERRGYQKAKDLICYRYDLTLDTLPNRNIIERPEWRGRLAIRNIDLNNLHRETPVMVELFNSAWSENWGFVPWTEKEFSAAADTLKHVMRPEGGFIVELDGIAQAFGLILPNVFEIISDLNGKLFPFGLLKVLWRLKRHKYKTGLLALFGIRKHLQGTVAGGAITMAFIEECRRRSRSSNSIEQLQLGWVLEDNVRMRRAIELVGAPVATIRRIYGKTLQS